MKTATAALVVLVLLAAGCSSRGPEEQLRAAWKANGEALKTRDTKAICDMLSDKARRHVLNGVHRSAIPGVNSCQTLWAKIFARFGENRGLHVSAVESRRGAYRGRRLSGLLCRAAGVVR